MLQLVLFHIFTQAWSSEEIDRLKLALKRTCVCPEAEKYSRKIKSNKVVVGSTMQEQKEEEGDWESTNISYVKGWLI